MKMHIIIIIATNLLSLTNPLPVIRSVVMEEGRISNNLSNIILPRMDRDSVTGLSNNHSNQSQKAARSPSVINSNDLFRNLAGNDFNFTSIMDTMTKASFYLLYFNF